MLALCSPELELWILRETSGAETVVDFGAGFFDKFNCVPKNAKMIGIEVFAPYTAYAKDGVRVVLDDMRNWAEHIGPEQRDVAMLIDTIEHLPKEDGMKLLCELTESFRKVIVFTPNGYDPQDYDESGMGNEWQSHECGWSEDELAGLGFVSQVDDKFHRDDMGAIFAVWARA